MALVWDSEEGGHGSGCSCPSDPLPLLKHRSRGELSVCSDLYLASRVAFNQLGSWRGSSNMGFPVPLAARARRFHQHRFSFGSRSGGQDGDGRREALVQVRCRYCRGEEMLGTSSVVPGLGAPPRVSGEVPLSRGWGWEGL